MQITVTDEEYAWLAETAARTGQSIEALVHAAVAEAVQHSSGPDFSPAMSVGGDPLIAQMRRMGHIVVSDEASESPEEVELPPYGSEEEERLLTEVGLVAAEAARRLGKSAVELVREDRDSR